MLIWLCVAPSGYGMATEPASSVQKTGRKKYMEFQPNIKERRKLKTLGRREKDTRALLRVLAFLWLGAGATVQEVAKRLSVSRQVIYHSVARFEDPKDLTLGERIHDGLRAGLPRSAHGVIDPLSEEVMNQEPRGRGHPGVEWTSGALAPTSQKSIMSQYRVAA